MPNSIQVSLIASQKCIKMRDFLVSTRDSQPSGLEWAHSRLYSWWCGKDWESCLGCKEFEI